MPEMNGIEAAKIIQRYRSKTKIILLTGYEDVKKEALEAGLSFLAKPISIEKFAESLVYVKTDSQKKF